MHEYGVREVEKLLRLPRSTIRALVASGMVAPARGPRNAWRFSFRDLIVLRTAQTLVAAKVPHRRITRSMKALRRRLPDAMPLSGLSICAIGDQVVVREGANRWRADSGQYLLAFEGDPADGSLSVIERNGAEAPVTAEAWFDRAATLEGLDTEAALHAYEKALAARPTLLDAHINLGRLLHEAAAFVRAERVYRDAIETCGPEPVLLYNLGVLLDDLGRKPEAMAAYETALQADPAFADCHYNLALLYEEVKRPREALRHMAQYRKLVHKRSD